MGEGQAAEERRAGGTARAAGCGRLEISRAMEQPTPLMISANIRHKTHAGVRIVGLS